MKIKELIDLPNLMGLMTTAIFAICGWVIYDSVMDRRWRETPVTKSELKQAVTDAGIRGKIETSISIFGATAITNAALTRMIRDCKFWAEQKEAL